MEPRIYQFYNKTADAFRPVSPTFSNWSPMVPNPLDDHNEQQQEENKSRSRQFPMIHRSFAFDEWDDEEDNEDDVSYNSSYHNDNDPGCQPETLAVVPTVEYGHTIYDATQGQLQHQASNKSKVPPPSLDTYMTVIHLDDTMTSKIHNKTTFSSTSTETFGNNNHDFQGFHHSLSSPFKFRCQSIPRHSMTYRWTTEGQIQSNEAPDNGGMEDTDDHSHSSSSSEQHFPIPEYITVYKNE